jgi:hypothetical protein
MSREGLGGHQAEAIIQLFARVVEQTLEDPSHREDGRACIYCSASDIDLPHLAARRGSTFADDDLHSGSRQIGGRRQATHASADDNDATTEAHREGGSDARAVRRPSWGQMLSPAFRSIRMR